jgi:hypothetical protein
LFYARCSLIEDLAFGLDTGRNDYATKSFEALDRLFGAGAQSDRP